MSEKPDYGTSLLIVLKTVTDFQDAELTYASREHALFHQNTALWNRLNETLLSVVGVVAAVNPDALKPVADTLTELIRCSEEIWEVSALRQKNAQVFVARIHDAQLALPNTEAENGVG